MSYEVTATRRRPRTFDELIGQDFVVATLKSSIASGRIAHAYLFSGPRGVGKTSAARILAKALNCPDGPDPAGCDDSAESEEITRGTALDVIEIDGASNTSVNDVRQIKDEVLFAPNSSRYKIYIIDEVHMLSNSAFNALLKTIEEPPPYIVFIFATTEIHKVPATIRSRCQQFNFRLIPMDDIKRLLRGATEELGVTAADEALAWIAKEATGSLRDAYTLLDQVVAFSDGNISLDVIHAKLGLLGLDRLNALMTAVVDADAAAAVSIVDDALQAGVSVERFTIDLADYLRTLLLIHAGIEREAVLGIQPSLISREVRDAYDRQQLELANELVLQLYRDLRYSVNQRFDLELAVSRLVSLRTLKTPHALVREIRALADEVRTSSVTTADGSATATGEASTSTPAGGAAESEGEESIDFDEPPTVEGITHEQVTAIMGRFRTQRISVAALLARARLWRLEGGTLLVAFVDDFSAHALAPDREAVQSAAIAELGLEHLKVDIETLADVPRNERDTATPGAADPATEMVRRVFRGEVVEDQS